MADQKLLNRAITISAKEEKLQAGKPVVKIKDEKGLTYTVYKLKQDGSESIAWGQLSELNLGDTVQIGYVEDIVESAEFGKVTYRTIRNFNKDIGNGMVNAAAQTTPASSQGKTSNTGHSGASGRGSSDAFGRRLGVQGHINALLSNPNVLTSTYEPVVTIPHIVKLAIEIEDEAERQINPVSESKTTEPEALPTIHADEDMDVEDIPFN